MSLVKRYFLSNYTYKTVFACCSLFKETRINRAQYYTCLNNSGNVQSTIFNNRKSEERSGRDMSIMSYVMESSVVDKTKNYLMDCMAFFPTILLKDKKLGRSWYLTLENINMEEFFTLLKMEDTFYSWFKVIQLHIWMLLCHLPRGGTSRRSVRIGMIQSMWKDTESRCLILTKGQRCPKKTKEMFRREFLFASVNYDLGFKGNDMALTNAVWICFFNTCNEDPRLLEALVSYIRYQMHHLSKVNYDELNKVETKANIWTPLRPHVERIINS